MDNSETAGRDNDALSRQNGPGDDPTNRDAGLSPRSPDESLNRIEVDGRIIWQAIGAVLLTLFLLWAIRQAAGLVSMLAIAFFFSLALDPGARWLVDRYGWRRGAATGVIYLVGALFVVLMVAIMIPSIAQLAQVIGERGAQWVANLQAWTSDTFGAELTGLDALAEASDDTGNALGDFSDDAFGTALGIAAQGVNFVFSMATIAMFAFYFTADAPRIQRATLRLFSPAMQERIGWTWDQAIVQTGGYFYSRLLLMLINGLGFFFTMVLVGLPVNLSLAMALFGSFVSVFIPVIGTYIGGAVPVILSLAIQGLTAGIIVLAYVLIYQQVENYWLSPKLSAKTMTLNGGVAFGAALAGGSIAGPMGAFTALPVAALISSFISNYLASHEVIYQSEERERTTRTKDARSRLGPRKASATSTDEPSHPDAGSSTPETLA
jgi:predicted PurR-regulated permease PerM